MKMLQSEEKLGMEQINLWEGMLSIKWTKPN